MRYIGITPKLTLIFILFTGAVLAGFGIPAYYSGRSALEAAVVSELLTSALEKQAALDSWVEFRQQGIGEVANLPDLSRTATAFLAASAYSPEAANAHAGMLADLENWAGAGHRFLSLEVIEAASGRVIAATDPLEEGKIRADQAYFLNGLKAAIVQNPNYDPAQQRPIMMAAAPILSLDGPVLAVLAGQLNIEDVNAIIQRRSSLHQTDDSFLVDTSNRFVTAPRLNTDPAVLQGGIHTEAVALCLAQNSGVLTAPDYRGVPAFIIYRWLPERQLCLIEKLDQAEALAPTRTLASRLGLTGGLILLIGTVLAIWVTRTITRPIQQLAKGAVEIGSGNLEYRLAMPAKDEIGRLAGEFNLMAGSIKNMRAQILQRTAQLESANKELEAFSYSISHDLRAPLRAMDGFSRILLEEHASQLPTEARRYLGLVRDNAQQMGRLLEDLLAFSRLSRLPLNKQTVSPAGIVQKVLAELRLGQEQRKVEVTLGDLPDCQADPALLKQVWINLLSNAFKFTSKCEAARIEIGAISDFKSQISDSSPHPSKSEILNLKSAIYYVRDNGVGFDMQYAGKLFGVFQRLHRAVDFEGTGVGLTIVQRIVNRHGGRIWAEAEVDKGATFYFTI